MSETKTAISLIQKESLKILVIRFSSIGDIVLATPVFRLIKDKLPNAQLHFVTKEAFKDVTIANPYINQFFYYNNNLGELTQQLINEKYDIVFDLHNNIRSNKIKKALGCKYYTINKLNFQKFILTKLHINTMPNRHITQRSIDTLNAINIVDDGKGLDYFIPKKEIISNEDLPLSHSLGFIALVIGASYKTKKMPVEKLQELCKKLNYPIVLVGGIEDRAEAEQIAAVDAIKIYNACGKYSINESADIIQKSKLVISHDTGMQYIACAFNKKVIAIWGSTSPKLQVEPYYGTDVSAQQKNKLYYNSIVTGLWCQPCSKYGNNTCPLGHFKCMKNQDIDYIVNKAYHFLNIQL